jgi:hypothetical protein
LTLVSGTAVPTTDQANKSTVYFTPYNGSRISLYNGTKWISYTYTEKSIALSGLTAGKNYDVFIYDNSGTLTLELSAAWTSDTARSTALTTQNNVYVKSGATTRRYLGTIRATAATQTQDTSSQRFVWNYYNRVRRMFSISESTNSWTYSTASFRAVNNNTANKIEYVTGINETLVFLRGLILMDADGTDRQDCGIAFGLDSATSSLTNGARGGAAMNVLVQQSWAEFQEIANGLGYHYMGWNEYGNTNVNFYGDAGDVRVQSGVLGYFSG